MKYILLVTVTLLFFCRCSFTDNAKVVNDVINEIGKKHGTKINGEMTSSNYSKNEGESFYSVLTVNVYSDSNYLGFYNNILYEIVDGLKKKGKGFSEYQVRDGSGAPVLNLTNEAFNSLKECRTVADKANDFIINKEFDQLIDVIDRKHIKAHDTTIINTLSSVSIPKKLEYVGFVPIDVLNNNDTIRLVNFAYHNFNLHTTLTITMDPESALVAGIE